MVVVVRLLLPRPNGLEGCWLSVLKVDDEQVVVGEEEAEEEEEEEVGGGLATQP